MKFADFDCAYVLICDCVQMRSCCQRFEQGSMGLKFADWYGIAYWYNKESDTSDTTRVFAECIHIQALRKKLNWSSPMLPVSGPYTWCEPIPLVTVLEDGPLISVEHLSGETLLASRVFVWRWGKKMICSKCPSRTGTCHHIKACLGFMQTESVQDASDDYPFLPLDDHHEDDEQLRKRIESGEKLLEEDGTLTRCTQVTVPYRPNSDCLLNAVVAVKDIPDVFYAENEEELILMGGAALARCNMCGSNWANDFTEPIEKILFTEICSKKVTGIKL